MDENPFIRLSVASVELPDGTEFEQYVMRMRRTATTVVVDDQDRVLLMFRHRFIVDRWVWELPTHPQRMRDELTAALQIRWEDSLHERATIVPHSPVPLLDGLLASHREAGLRATKGPSRS